jgi:L-lactate dehydrogenase complex protein LldF
VPVQVASRGIMLPVLLIEPVSSGKRRHFAEILREPRTQLQPSLEDVERRLREVRSYTLDHLDVLASQLKATLAGRSEVEVTFAADIAQVVKTVREASGGTNGIAVNKSSVVAKELVPALISSGFEIIESYYNEMKPFENKFGGYWDLPQVTFESLSESFARPVDLMALRRSSIQENGTKDFVGLLGVNAVSASDGAVLFLQQSSNISKVFEQAKKVILVAGLEKIVRNLDDAIFQTKCMALFGFETLALDLHSGTSNRVNIESLPFDVPPQQAVEKIHLILLDNGRSQMLRSRYKELLACIGCRACARTCPAYQFLVQDARWSPREYVYFLGRNPSMEHRLCLQCKTCEANCPLGIDLPGMILDVKAELMLKKRRSLTDRVLANAEMAERWGSHTPWLANPLMRSRTLRWLGEKTLGISKERQLPRVQRKTFAKWFRSEEAKSGRGSK